MDEVGLRELRQNASDLVRRAQAGEQVTVTVAGRPAAVLGPASRSAWRTWDQVADVFTGNRIDTEWDADRDLMDPQPRDPWAER